MRLLIATDAWLPQVNGVVRTLERMNEELPKFGVEVIMLTPDRYRTIPMPTYPDIRISLASPNRIGSAIAAARPDAVHIVTEGPLGYAARRWARKNGRPFTTSFHTLFPEYLAARLPVPLSWTYRALRGFHNAGSACMVPTQSVSDRLESYGFTNLAIWSRGVDGSIYRPRPGESYFDLPRPIFLCVGRVAVEKNLDAFLKLDLPGSKVVVGEGPALEGLRRAYPKAYFTGLLPADQLSLAYAAADVFVFPSRTDTFGNVMLEALASGVPVAAYPVTGPKDVIGNSGAGVLDNDLGVAALAALDIPRARCRTFALQNSWHGSATQFLRHVTRANGMDALARTLAPVPAG